MFVQSESFDLFTAQVLHFTRHSPPITRATVALPASQSAVAAACNPSTRLDSTLLIYTSAGSVQWGKGKRRESTGGRAWQQPSMLLQQHKEQEGERAREGGREKQKYFPSDFNRSRDFFTCHAPVYTHTPVHANVPVCASVCV